MGKIVNAIKPKVTIYETDKKDVQWAMHESTLAGPLGALPGIADMAAITGIWAILLHLMAKNHGINLTKEKSRELCECIFKGVIKYIAGCKAATQLVNLVPGAGTLIAVAGSTFENVVFTYRFARAVTDTMLTDKMDGFGGTAERVIKNFAYELCAADMDEMVKIYFMPGGDFAEFANNAKELAIDTATYVGDTLLTGVETIVEGTKKAGKAIKDFFGNW